MGTKLRVLLASLAILLLVSLSVNALFFHKILSRKKPDNSIAIKEFRYNNSILPVSVSAPPVQAPLAFPFSSSTDCITIVFDKKIAAQDKLHIRIPELPIVFTPKISGVFEWQSEDTLTLNAPPLPAGTVFTARFTDYIEKMSGKSLRENEKTCTFSTPPVRFLHAKQVDTNTGKSVNIQLDFNDKVAPEMLARHVSFSQNGRKLNFDVLSKTPEYSLKCALFDISEGVVSLSIKRGFKGVSGTIGTAQDACRPVPVSYSMRIFGVEIDRYDDNTAHIQSSIPIDTTAAKEFIKITPEVPFSVSNDYYGAELTGDFAPGTLYEISFLPGLPGRPDSNNGQPSSLVNEITFNAVFRDFEPSITFSFNGAYLLKDGSANVPVTLLNIQSLSVQVSRIYDNNIPFLILDDKWKTYNYHIKGFVAKKDVPVSMELNKPETILLDLNEILRGIESPHGAYEILVKADTMPLNRYDGSSYIFYRDKTVVVSDIGITAKKYGDSVFVWLNTISTAAPMPGATVTILSSTNQSIAKMATDNNGVAVFENLKFQNDLMPDIILAQKNDDFTFLDFQPKILPVSEFDTSGRPSLTKGYEAFIFCDRGLYRPGEKAHVKSIVRGPGTAVPEKFPVLMEITRPGNKVLLSSQLILSELGTIEQDFDIPDFALTGRYNISVKIPGSDAPIGSYSFLVQEFVPDTIKVSMSCENRRFAPGERVKITVNAKHYFGKPVSDQPVHLRAFLEPDDFSCANYSNFAFGPDRSISEKTAASIPVFTASGKTGGDGNASFEFEIPKNLQPNSMLRLQMEASVTPQAARAVTVRESQIVDPYPYYLGVRELPPSAADSRKFAIAIIAPDGTPCRDIASLDIALFKVNYYYVLERKNGHFDYTYHKSYSQLETSKLAWPVGTKQVEFETRKISKPGDYSIRVSSPITGHFTESVFYKDYGYSSMFEKQDAPYYLNLELDKKEYKTGETAVVKFPTPFAGKVLLTVEREKILSYSILDITGPVTEFSLEVRPEYLPNVYIAAHAVLPVKSDTEMGFFRAYGIARLNVNTDEKNLVFSALAPDTVQPGGKLEVQIQTDPQNVKSEFTIAVVDEGVCALTGYGTPDPKGFFYGAKKLCVDTSDIYSYLMPDLDEKRLKEKQKSGGGDEGGPREDVPEEILNFAMPVRNSMKMAAFYQDRLVPDQNGRIAAYFDMPEFSGEMRVMVFAVGTGTFGMKEFRTKIKGPVTVQPLIPVTLTQNDSAEIPVAVFNNTEEPRNVTVSIAANQWLKTAGPAEQRITLQAQKEAFLYFGVLASGINETGMLDFTVLSEDFSQKLHYEIPIRPANPFITVSDAGSIMLTEYGNTALKINLFSDWVKGSGEYSITFSPAPALQCLPGLEYLKHYPYGCVEQTTSQCFALLYYKELQDSFGKTENAAELDGMIYSGINRLLTMQNSYNGGLSMWPGGSWVYPWGSVYAAHFLAEAKKKGYRVNEESFSRLMAFLEEDAGFPSYRGKADSAVSAYALYVLALNGRKNMSGRINSLLANDENSGPSVRYMLALAGIYSGNKELAARVLGKTPGITTVAYSETDNNLLSSVKENALLLMALIETSPSDPMIPELIKAINLEMKHGYWGNTQNTAFAVMALGKTAYLYEKMQSGYAVSITNNGHEIAVFSEHDTVTLDKSKLQGPVIELNARGKGILFYTWKASGIPSGPVKEMDCDMQVRRKILDPDGKEIDLNNLKAGQLLIVKLNVSSDSTVNNMVIVDMLPSGMEIENPAFATRALAINEAFIPLARQIRDDRMILFGGLSGKTECTYTYLARAVIPGEYYLPPVSAECMYSSGFKSINGAGRIRITAK